MISIAQRLRDIVQTLRRTPMPIADVVPLLQQAGDALDQAHDKQAQAEREIARLTDCLKQANAQAEDFERRYYLKVNECEDLQAQLAVEPSAWLYECRKPGKAMTYASIDPADTNHWPLDQWKEVTRSPLICRNREAPVSLVQNMRLA